MCTCICVCICARIFQLFQFQVAYRIKNGICVYDCVRACVSYVCVCAWQLVAHIRLTVLAAKGLRGKDFFCIYMRFRAFRVD